MASTPGVTPRPRRLSIAALLALALGGLVSVSVSGVLLLTLTLAARNTFELLEDKGRILLGSVAERTRQHLRPAEAQVEFLAGLMEAGDVSPDDPVQLFEALRAALAAAPQIHGVTFLDADGWSMVAQRGVAEPEPEVGDWRGDPVASHAVAEGLTRLGGGRYWGPPLHLPEQRQTVLNLRRPVAHDGRFLGLLASVVTVRELSEFVAELETEIGQHAFILYDRRYVLAAPALRGDYPGLSAERPIPEVGSLGDPVLAAIWSDGWEGRRLRLDLPGHVSDLGGRTYLFLYRELDGYADAPLLVGSYFEEGALASQTDRLIEGLLLGLLALALAVGLALVLARGLSAPIRQLAESAAAVSGLDLERVPMPPRSRLRELDEAAVAFAAMVAGLRSFALYVPRRLVLGLIQRGDVTRLDVETREVTVMFTDIVGFSGRAEGLSGAEVARFLNHHFALLTARIEAEGGTVDKFIGDAVMAFWGAPEEQPDHAARAARAALAIAEDLRRDNAGRPDPVRVRIGLHSGPAVVGNIGAATRMNYTLVGETVNAAARLQELGKRIAPGAEAVVLVSAATRRGLPAGMAAAPLGRLRLRGFRGGVEVFRVV